MLAQLNFPKAYIHKSRAGWPAIYTINGFGDFHEKAVKGFATLFRGT